MITFKVNGVNELIAKFQGENFVPANEIDKIVREATQPLIDKVKNNYIAAGHKKTGALVNSIASFQRKRKGKADPFFTYYVGPRYTSGRGLFSMGGNAAHLLEYGTAERYRANVSKGGVGKKQGLRGVYGAKSRTGKVMGTGVLRKSFDEYKGIGEAFIKARITNLILAKAKQKGLAA